MMRMAERALAFATNAHGSIDQRRKYTGEPYIVHPMAVAAIVRTVPHNEAMIAAAYLHDVVEDTPITLADVRDEFGEEVGDLVFWLTDVSRPSDGNRALRKSLDREHLAEAPADAQTIKIADLLDNTKSIRQHDPDFWQVYRREKLQLLDVLSAGNASLMRHARAECAIAPPIVSR